MSVRLYERVFHRLPKNLYMKKFICLTLCLLIMPAAVLRFKKGQLLSDTLVISVDPTLTTALPGSVLNFTAMWKSAKSDTPDITPNGRVDPAGLGQSAL